MLSWLNRFHGTRLGFLAFAVITLVLAYASVSWAINSGSWLAYLLTLLFFVAFLQNLVKLITALLFPRRPLAKHQPLPKPRPARSVNGK